MSLQTQVFISYVIRAACPPKDPLIHERVCHRGACGNQLEDKVIIQNAATCPDDHSCVARILLVDPRLMGSSSKPQWLPWSIVMDLTPQETSLGHDNMPCPKQMSLANTFFQVFFSFQGVYIDVISGLVGVTWVIDCTIVYHLLIKGIAWNIPEGPRRRVGPSSTSVPWALRAMWFWLWLDIRAVYCGLHLIYFRYLLIMA